MPSGVVLCASDNQGTTQKDIRGVRRIWQDRKIRGLKICSIIGNVLFLIQSGWSALWPLYPPSHMHSVRPLVSITSQGHHDHHSAHQHQAVLHRDGSLVWYNVYPDAHRVKMSFRETDPQETSPQHLLLLTSDGRELFQKARAYSFLCIPSLFVFPRTSYSEWNRPVYGLLPAAGYIFLLDHPPKSLSDSLAVV